ncbi:MAG: dockerin type I domain-containing protein [Pirellulales bacterium]
MGLLVLALGTSAAHATATVQGNVLLSSDDGATFFADNPFTTTVNEGIPTAGNSLNENQGTMQTNFEGRPDTKGTATTADDDNLNFDVYVGRTSYGLLTINGGTQLRDMNLIIGDSGTVPNLTGLQRGTGVVRIENPGSLYNNNPDILPFPFSETGQSPSINPRSSEPGAADGFDLFVGRNGTGELAISLGGRAEIQDAAIVGMNSGSVGTLTIDGVGSFLQSGGFESTNNNPDIVNYMIIGSLGSGTMSITNGGQSYNAGAVSQTTVNNVFAAVIGSNLAAIDNDAPADGGNGTVYVDGTSSRWITAGNLQVGGFHDNRIGTGPTSEEDLEGNEAIYNSGVGRGTLNVTNGALVSIVTPPLDENAADAPNRLDLLVGAFGKINLDGGRIELLGAFNIQDPQNPTQQVPRGRLINDGVVSGSGSISTLQFRNRVLGQVQVGAGQLLKFESTGAYTETDNIPVPNEQEYPLSNYGVIDVLGTETARAEVQFDRNPVTMPAGTNVTRPFLNLPITGQAAANGRTEGLIHGEYSTMRFKSGLWNRGVLAFTKGNNVVSGDVISFGESVPGAGDQGRVLIGPDTNVAFEDDFFSFGVTQISPGSTFQVLKGNSFAVGGTFSIGVQGSSSGMTFDAFQITGDASFSGNLQVSFTNGNQIPSLSTVPIFNVGGSITGNFTQVTPSGLPFGSPIDFFTFVFGNQLYLASFTVPTPVPGVDSPDLNGDGQVNDFDFQIWRQNFGTTGPAGDANGDGRVDAADWTVINDHCCGAFPGGGSGAGYEFGLGGTVPEPASATLLASVGLLALAFGRRRAS